MGIKEKIGEELDKEIDSAVAPKSKIRVLIFGALLTAAVAGVGFLIKMQWDMVQEQAIISTKVQDMLDSKSNEDSAQWRLLKEFNDNKTRNDLEIQIMKRIQIDFILPLLIHNTKNGNAKKPTGYDGPLALPKALPNFKEALNKLDEHKPKIDAEQFRQRQMTKKGK